MKTYRLASGPSPEAEQIDREEAEKHPCDRCGGKCRYSALTIYDENGTLRSYKAYAVCTVCYTEREI